MNIKVLRDQLCLVKVLRGISCTLFVYVCIAKRWRYFIHPGSKLLSVIERKPSSTTRLEFTTQTRTHSIRCHDTNRPPPFSLRTGHCRLNSYRKRTGVKTSVQCRCGDADLTPEHYLQSSSLHQQARRQIWPTCVSLKTKL